MLNSYFAVAKKRPEGLRDTQVRGAIRDRTLNQVKAAVYKACDIDHVEAQRYRGFKVYPKDSVYEYMLQNISDRILASLAPIKRAASLFNKD